MNVIFCDIDGVLNNHRTLARNHKALDPECVAVLNALVELIDGRIVISSTWRLFHELDELREMLGKAGLHDTARVIGTTPRLLDFKGDICVSQPRGREIQAWLADHPEVRRFVILDDDSDMDGVMRHHVKTDTAVGLTRNHLRLAERALRIDRSAA